MSLARERQSVVYKLLRLSSTARHLRQIHAQLYVQGLHQDQFLVTQIITLCRRLSELGHALASFSVTHRPNSYTLNAALEALAGGDTALKLRSAAIYRAHLRDCRLGDTTRRPNCFTFSPLLRSCSCSPEAIPQVHAHVTKFGAHADVYVGTTLLDSYSKRGDSDAARQLFDQMPDRNVVTWNSMISSFARDGDVAGARKLFDGMPERNEASWTCMITGYAQNGYFDETLALFSAMNSAGVRLNDMAAVSLLSACANLGALNLGRKIHQLLDRRPSGLDLFIGTALIDMYSKCGGVEEAVEVFHAMPEKNVVAFSSMIMGLAMNGRCAEALRVFDRMTADGFWPNDVTLVGVLCACCHGGLVEEGRRHFSSMERTYSIVPKLQHYTCIVDLLGRAGRLRDALRFIEEMPLQPDVIVWGALLGACRIHGDLELGNYSAGRILQLDPQHSGGLVFLSNSSAKTRDWNGVRRIGRKLGASPMKKIAGKSWIEIDGTVHQFFAGDQSHLRSDEIYAKLAELAVLLEQQGHSPDIASVICDVEEEDKEQALYVHSEKLALAFGLISTSGGAAIRIVKNLRVCLDCHSSMKLISKIVRREIILRDGNRFHHFSGGACSCGDYW